MSHHIKDLLSGLGIISDNEVELLFKGVRDNSGIDVFRCTKSGVIFLSSSDHIDISHYSDKPAKPRSFDVKRTHDDNLRRFKTLRSYFINRKWLDIGTGSGGILELLKNLTSHTCAVEPQRAKRKQLTEAGYECFASIDDCPKKQFDIISLFHVVEHFTTPLKTLRDIRTLLSDQGRIIIEIPHAKDILLSLYDSKSFMKFTFWSEHLILHTRESITRLLDSAGYRNIHVQGIQRYPLANHLYWLNNHKPGGHTEWAHLVAPGLDQEYANQLCKHDVSDTLLVFAEV